LLRVRVIAGSRTPAVDGAGGRRVPEPRPDGAVLVPWPVSEPPRTRREVSWVDVFVRPHHGAPGRLRGEIWVNPRPSIINPLAAVQC
jgi:hypothetical protein